MSLIIKSDMKLPVSCDKCPVCDYEQGNCLVSNDRSTLDVPDRKQNRAEWCPLGEIHLEAYQIEFLVKMIKAVENFRREMNEN